MFNDKELSPMLVINRALFFTTYPSSQFIIIEILCNDDCLFNVSYLGGHTESYSGRLRLLVCFPFSKSVEKRFVSQVNKATSKSLSQLLIVIEINCLVIF